MPEISERTRKLGTENAFVVLKEVQDQIYRGKDVISFCIGQPDFDTPKHIKDHAIKAITDGKTGYTASEGMLTLRSAIAEMQSEIKGIEISPDDVVVANGAKPFIGYSIMSTTEYGKGHEVIYPRPGYPIYESQVIVHGTKAVPLDLLEKKDFAFDLTALSNIVNKNTKLLIINSPQNPTGGILQKKELEEIAELAIKYDFFVLADEVYSRIVYDKKFESIASLPNMFEHTIIMDGLSKAYSMTGWRIGYAINPKLAKYLSKWVTNVESCAGHPNQYAALQAIKGPQKDSEKMISTFRTRRDLIVKLLNEIPGVKCKLPGGAFYAYPNVTEACKKVCARNAEEFRRMLLEDAGVAVLSDIHFGSKVEGEGEHIRFSYATSSDNIKNGLKRMKEFVINNTKQVCKWD